MFAIRHTRALAFACTTLLAACALDDARDVRSTNKFDPSDVRWSKALGRNTIFGVARLTANGGKPRTCASLQVRLAPDSDYVRTRIERLYGDNDEGFVDARSAQRLRTQQNVDRSYESALKTAVCDPNGNFAFRNLPDGTYYVLAPVVWKNKLGEVAEGGFYMQRVTVAGGETRTVTLASR